MYHDQFIKMLGSIFYFPKHERKNRVFYVLILIAFIRPVGFVFQSTVIDGIGMATCVSPLPTVFSSPGGIEAFSSKYFIEYSNSSFESDTVAITPELFSKLEQPHPYRNAVSLAFGYFPILPDASVRSVLHHMFYEDKVLLDMGIPYSDRYTLINRNDAQGTVKEWKIQIRSNGE